MALLKPIAEEHAIIPKVAHCAKLKGIPEHLFSHFNFYPSFQKFSAHFGEPTGSALAQADYIILKLAKEHDRFRFSLTLTLWIPRYVHAINEANRNYFKM